jgi:hypothetical protein
MWDNFFRDGGFGMYPTALFGFLCVAASVALVLRPEPRFTALFRALALITVTSAVLGTTVGLIKTLRYAVTAPPGEVSQSVLVGCAESLNVVVLGFILATLGGLGAAIAAFRAARRPTTASVG